MNVSTVMTKAVDVIDADTPVREAAYKMRVDDVGVLPVADGHKLAGIITDRDITVRVTAEGRDPNTTPVRDAFTQGVEYCFEDQSVEEAVELMSKKQIRRLVVLNHEDRLAGIVSMSDIIQDTGDKKMGGELLEKVTRPSSKNPGQAL